MNIIIISGGSSGIGKSCVEKFLQHGDFVYNFDIKDCIEFFNNSKYKYVYTDVRNHDNIKNSIATVLNNSKTIDILITSAGRHLLANIEETTDKDLMDVLYINLLGTYWLIQESIPIMKKNNKGRILTIGSDQCTIAKKNSTVYGMTKSALLTLTKSVALDYAKNNIRINCIGAGTVDTPLYKNVVRILSNKLGVSQNFIEEEMANEQPVGRLGKAEDIAELSYFLTTCKTDFITGALIPIDGGYIAN